MDKAVNKFPMASKDFQTKWPNNCPVLERTADGDWVGICWFYLKDGVCPRHGRVKKETNISVKNC